MDPLRVSIVTFDSAATIEACLRSVLAEHDPPRRVTVVDNASGDGTVERVRSGFPEVELIEAGANRGFAAAHNAVLRTAAAPLALLLNPDARLEPGCVGSLVAALAAHPDVALAAPRVERPDGRPEVSFGAFPSWRTDLRQRRLAAAVARGDAAALATVARRLEQPHCPDWVSGVCLLARIDALRRVDFFDEGFFLYLEDVDLCRRLRAVGQRVMVEPSARCVHLGGKSLADRSVARREFRRSRLHYESKHGTAFGAWAYRLLRRV